MINSSLCGVDAVDGFPIQVAEYAARAPMRPDFLTQMMNAEHIIGGLWKTAGACYSLIYNNPLPYSPGRPKHQVETSPDYGLRRIADEMRAVAASAGVHHDQVFAMSVAIQAMINWPNARTKLDEATTTVSVLDSLNKLSVAELLPSDLFQQVWSRCCTACDGSARVTSPVAAADIRFCGCVQTGFGNCSRCGSPMDLKNCERTDLRSGEFDIHEARNCEKCGWNWGLDNGDAATR